MNKCAKFHKDSPSGKKVKFNLPSAIELSETADFVYNFALSSAPWCFEHCGIGRWLQTSGRWSVVLKSRIWSYPGGDKYSFVDDVCPQYLHCTDEDQQSETARLSTVQLCIETLCKRATSVAHLTNFSFEFFLWNFHKRCLSTSSIPWCKKVKHHQKLKSRGGGGREASMKIDKTRGHDCSFSTNVALAISKRG